MISQEEGYPVLMLPLNFKNALVDSIHLASSKDLSREKVHSCG